MRKVFSILFALALVLAFSLVATTPVAAATPIYVDASRPDDTGDGTSWATAKKYIQSGVNIVDAGGTVHVAAGIYDEQVVITKSLTLQGAGNATVVKPSSAAKLSQVFTGLLWSGGTRNIAGIIVANVPDGGSVIVRNLQVDKSSVVTKPTGADFLVGVFYRETGGTIDSVSVVGGGAWSGGDRGYGMYLSAETNTVSVEVKGCTITNFDKNGIEAQGSKLTVNIHHNTITGRGPVSDEGQNGVNVGRDAVATVNYNTITNLEYSPQTWWATGILFYSVVSPSGKSATAIGNTITNCQLGIYFVNFNAVAQNNTVAGGTVGLCGIGADVDAGTWTASFVGNTVSGAKDQSTYQNAAIWGGTYEAGATLSLTISNNQLTSGSTTADGIILEGSEGSTSATITNNTISGWEYGIRLRTASANAANSRANNNNIVGNTVLGVGNAGTGILDARYNWWGHNTGPGPVGPGSGDKVSTNVDYSAWIGQTVTATGTGTVTFVPSAGNPSGPTPIPESSLPLVARQTKPINFPHGLFAYNITGLTPGQAVNVTITLPPGTAVSQYWKYHPTVVGWRWVRIPMTIVGPPNVIRITLQDGGLGDADLSANGQIIDQGGPGNPLPVGWETYPVSNARVLLPWIALLAAIAAGVSLLVLRRRRAQS